MSEVNAMKGILIIAVLLGLASPSLAFAEQPAAKHTTLVVQFVGEMDRPIFPIIISTSVEEGEWYRQQLFQEPIRGFGNVYVVPASVLNQIAELPMLKHALVGAKQAEDVPKTTPTVRFVLGSGHDYVHIMLDAQTSLEILHGIAKLVSTYPALTSEIQEVENHLNGARK